MPTKTKIPSRRSTSSSRSAKRERTAHRPLEPFTVDHWRTYVEGMVLDNGEYWRPEPFQLEFVADVFSDAFEVWLVVPEGNGKTTLLAGVALYHGDYTEAAMVAMAASTRDQCLVLLNQAKGFIRRSPGLDRRFRPLKGHRRIDCLRTGGEIQVYAADERTGDGIIPSLALLDELHRHPNLDLHDVWSGKKEKRNAKTVAISTAGEPGGEFETARQRARTEAPDIQVKDRHIRAASRQIVLHDWALRPEDDPQDVALVARANPLSRITEAKLAEKLASPTERASHWSRFVCNLPTRKDTAAVGEAEWLGAEVPDPGLDGQPCDVGLDLGWKYDATALVPLFKVADGWLFGKSRIITPPRDGNSLSTEQIQSAFEQLHAQSPIQSVVMDPSAGGEQLAEWLEDDLGVRTVSHSQKTGPMALAAAKFMETLREGTQKHVHDPDFTRHVLNAVAKELPDGTFKFVRPDSTRGSTDTAPMREIDALIAAAMVLSSIAAGGYSGPLLEIV